MTKLQHDIAEKPGHAAIRAGLDRIVASHNLSKSPQLVSFLRFVVGATLAGKSRQIKAYTIATDAMGRDARFDPQADPIVRVEAGRLRRALDQYYANEGRNDPLAITMPRGSYVPVFRSHSAPKGALAQVRQWRSQAFGTLSENYRLVLLVAIVGAIVSTCLDLAWMVMPKLFAIAGQVLQQGQPLAK